MRVLVTGNQGRIGRYVQAQLEAENHIVVGFDRAAGDDIRQPAALRAAAQGCDAIIHMAAMLADPKDDPNDVMHVNLQGTWHVLTTAEALDIRRVVCFSSVNALGIFIGESLPDYLPINEEHPCRPGRPYALSKFLGEEMCRLFTRRTNITTICLRPPWVCFPENYARVRQRWAEKPESEWSPIWEYGAFCDVRDVAAAAVLGLTCADPGHARLLLCADDVMTSGRTSRELAAQIHPDVAWRGREEYESEPFRALVDNSQAKAVLGWQPRYSWQAQE